MVSRPGVPFLARKCRLYLDREVGLLESGTSHGLGARALAAGPDANTVGSLADLDRLGLVDGGGGRLGGLRGNGGLELPSRGGEGALGESRAARQDTNCPQLRCGHCDCVGYRVCGSIRRCRLRMGSWRS